MAVRKELINRFQVNNGPPFVWAFLWDKKISAEAALFLLRLYYRALFD
jgi:hypothetical protein